MVFFNKRNVAPPTLANRRSYRESDTIKALVEDFKNKCYICGDKGPTSLNVEHFDEHRNNPIKMYDWNNLFYACAHCNKVKNSTFPKGNSDLLNCTDKNQKVDLWIEYRIIYDKNLKASVIISPNMMFYLSSHSSKRDNTIKLLDEVFNGKKTGLKEQEAYNLTKKLSEELMKFNDKLVEYKKEQNFLIRSKLQQELTEMVAADSPFAAFKRWMIRDENMCLEIPFDRDETTPSGIILPILRQH